MKLYYYAVWWRYSSDNFAYGIVKAETREEAKDKVNKANPGNIDIAVSDIEDDDFTEWGTYEIYSR